MIVQLLTANKNFLLFKANFLEEGTEIAIIAHNYSQRTFIAQSADAFNRLYFFCVSTTVNMLRVWQRAAIDCCLLSLFVTRVFVQTARVTLQTKAMAAAEGGQQVSREYCEDESFIADRCRPDEAVLMTSAIYGRMRLGRCVNAHQLVNCSVDVLRYLDRRCSGRPSCRLPVTELVQIGTKPCSMDYRSFLEASYTCVPVMQSTSDGQCDVVKPTSATLTTAGTVISGSPQPIMTTSSKPQTGYLSSYVTSQTGCGGVDSPWQLRADQGQRIRLTILDFSPLGGSSNEMTSADAGNPSRSSQPFTDYQSGTTCHVYAVVREPSTGGQTRTVCGGRGERGEVVMISTGPAVDVRLVGKRLNAMGPGRDRAHGSLAADASRGDLESFMIGFQFLGCPNPPLQQGAWLKRDGEQATVGCGQSFSWKLTCIGDDSSGYEWSGLPDVTSPCPADDSSMSVSASGGQPVGHIFSVFRGLSAIVLTAVAAVVGLLVLASGLVFLSKRRRQLSNQSSVGRSILTANQFSSLDGTAGVGGRVYPPDSVIPVSKECQQLLLQHKTQHHRAAGSNYVTTGNDVIAYNRNEELPWQQQVLVGTGSRMPLPPTYPLSMPPHLAQSGDEFYSQSEHVYESPTFEKRSFATPGTCNVVVADYPIPLDISPHLSDFCKQL